MIVLTVGSVSVFLLTVVAEVLRKLLADEIVGYVPVLTARIIRRQVAKLPSASRERYEQEWIADAAQFHERRLAGLRFAIGLNRAVRELAAVGDPGGRPRSPVTTVDLVAPWDSSPSLARQLIARILAATDPGLPKWDDMIEHVVLDDLVLETASKRFVSQVDGWRMPVRPDLGGHATGAPVAPQGWTSPVLSSVKGVPAARARGEFLRVYRTDA